MSIIEHEAPRGSARSDALRGMIRDCGTKYPQLRRRLEAALEAERKGVK